MAPLKGYTKIAQELFTSLQTPISKYGIGMTLQIPSFTFEEAFASLQNAPATFQVEKQLKNISVKKLSEMDPFFLTTYMQALVAPHEDKFTALHYATLRDGLVLFVPPNYVSDEPINLLSYSKGKASCDHLIIVVGSCAHVTFLEDVKTAEETTYRSSVVQIYVDEGAHVEYYAIGSFSSALSFTIKRASVAKDSTVLFYDFLTSGKFQHLDVSTNLNGINAKSKIYTSFCTKEKTILDVHAQSFHNAKSTISEIKSRGILDDESKAIYRSAITITNQAPSSIAHQRCNVLLVGEDTHCDAIPVLDVSHDDVSCSHGVAIGRLRDDLLFYLTSRGLTQEQAKMLILQGFLEDFFKIVPVSLQPLFEKTLGENLVVNKPK